ncbi:uroporphyrinogen-III C-methyltransferase [Desulfovibrio subterraneus]|jgi:uroporphyrinogen III methyltransferase/synthase|uniref:uroporphyrinogen-III C-methyltransferase n=1 Tax=Desulfovibrio subterraneus TaxID=2718620 RepID=UPI0022B8A80E|nr:uroporphyrinogen-III C-methyltransferase [Desulfovibrio subterraneus]WBF67031.1 uroporphyrinogen-III C-methyltransferase [Desulfovibrio subterraneus]
MKVYLIGAGPGDPGLLTIKGRDVLSEADVIVYDYLANSDFLNYAKPGAEIIYVGKKGGDHTLSQEGINKLIVDKAKEGKVVARLKGGDPYMFGRGGEEAEELLDAGVTFEEIPGITSAIAGPAYAGIPLTHRDYASSVAFITGHENPDKPGSSHNWDALAKGTSTLVFFMGMKNLPHISAQLIKHGMDPNTPAALVHWGTTTKHRSMASTIEKLPVDGPAQGFTSPSLIVVGGVVNLRERLNWYEQLPLLGKSVVVTRAREQASGMAAQLRKLGANVIQFPTIKINPLAEYADVHAAIRNLADYEWLIFTSVNGVKHFWLQMAELGLDTRAIGKAKVAAIGPATADILREKGIEPDFIPEKYVAEGVVQGLLERGMNGSRVLLPRAKEAREVLPEELRKAGATVDILPVYETVPAGEARDTVMELLEKDELHCVTFGSSSTVDNFFALVSPEVVKKHKAGLKLASIGPITAKTLESYGFTPDIQPEDYTIPALVEELKKNL